VFSVTVTLLWPSRSATTLAGAPCHLLLAATVPHIRANDDALYGANSAVADVVDAVILLKVRGSEHVLRTIQRYGTELPETAVTLDPETGTLSGAESQPRSAFAHRWPAATLAR
jgi:hypothetical protein